MKVQTSTPEFLTGGGEMGQRIREYDWSSTPLGPVEGWPQSLRTCVRIMLASRQPIWMGWGPELIKLYNDPYKAIVGGKHPWALGQPASVVWKDIWREIGPMLQHVREEDEGTYVESQLLIMERYGYPEETYYTFSYTPIPGEDGIPGGMICFNTDDTERVISERQLKTLSQLSKSLSDSQSYMEVMEKTMLVLADNPYDFPFAHKYPADIAIEKLEPYFRQAEEDRKPVLVDEIQSKLPFVSKGAWEIESRQAILLPLFLPGEKDLYGFLLTGVNPYRLPDEKYWNFFNLIVDQLSNSFADIHVLEAKRIEAEALAEIDRAKTQFFSNISHEFRTPLTLLLGPVEDVLNDPETHERNRARMEIAYRNVLRMQKLVNMLLEFSRIEAGRMEGKYRQVEMGLFTSDLVTSFRSAVEKAGMRLIVNVGEILDPVFVDVDMWEQIVLNLVSNALKYTRAGSITVDIREVDKQLLLTVTDTGVGIPANQLEKIFDRFHRVENSRGRSQEGTGIGLAMVRELVRLHDGSIAVTSELGKGSSFTVALPVGKEHLPADKILTSVNGALALNHAEAYISEALKWLPEEGSLTGEEEWAQNAADNADGAEQDEDSVRRIVLLADDNSDMREYVRRLLSGRYVVITAADGEEGYEKLLRYHPDLVLSDIMMPRLDGLGFLAKIRANPRTKNIPVIFLSARAGEEAKVDGMAAGADDYLVKPFSARELLARVDANIRLAVSRVATEKHLQQLADSLEVEVGRRTDQLQHANESLIQSNEDLQRFAHVASHDLKEPVRKIRTFSDRLKEEFGEELPPQAKVFINKILHATERMYSMIEGVLSWSSLNHTDTTIEPIDLAKVLTDVEVDLELSIAEKHAVVTREGDFPVIDGAAVLIYQLMYNLVNNALKFVRRDVVPVITVSARKTKQGVEDIAEIIVSDNGIGFDQIHAEQIFDTFTRLNSKDKFEGTGLGLALCKKIVERHHGSIRASGEKDRGASFIIQLPIKQQQQHI